MQSALKGQVDESVYKNAFRHYIRESFPVSFRESVRILITGR